MRRGWRGRYRNNWYRPRGRSTCNNSTAANQSIHQPSTSQQISHNSVASSRAPANQIPLVIAVSKEHQNDTWKLYFPTEGNLMLHIYHKITFYFNFNHNKKGYASLSLSFKIISYIYFRRN